MDQKTLDQIKIYLAEATQTLLTLNRLLENIEQDLRKENPTE